jgi:hypothetical protein
MKIRRTLFAVGGAVALAATLFTSTASAAPAHRSPAARTCAAFQSWSHHRTPARLDALMVASVAAPWSPLGADVVVLFTDVRDGDHLDQPADIHAIAEDCHR